MIRNHMNTEFTLWLTGPNLTGFLFLLGELFLLSKLGVLREDCLVRACLELSSKVNLVNGLAE